MRGIELCVVILVSVLLTTIESADNSTVAPVVTQPGNPKASSTAAPVVTQPGNPAPSVTTKPGQSTSGKGAGTAGKGGDNGAGMQTPAYGLFWIASLFTLMATVFKVL